MKGHPRYLRCDEYLIDTPGDTVEQVPQLSPREPRGSVRSCRHHAAHQPPDDRSLPCHINLDCRWVLRFNKLPYLNPELGERAEDSSVHRHQQFFHLRGAHRPRARDACCTYCRLQPHTAPSIKWLSEPNPLRSMQPSPHQRRWQHGGPTRRPRWCVHARP